MRRYYRCKDCLGVFTVEFENPREIPRYEDYTCACDGNFENMGDVRRNRLTKTYDTTPCDERCTSALGPICNCHCGGKNHGTHLVIKITKDVGAVPRVTFDEKHEKRGREFRELFNKALAAWKAKYTQITDKKNRGWIPREEFNLYYEGNIRRRLLTKARDMKTFSLRQKKLQKFIDDWRVNSTV